ncbi:arylsulfatase [Blastopirellula marina]|uniref:Arylsulfatase n=1 Tax=Blastopirellula marina TaxID=124 RepID=A0A2S8F1R4_9BACT|nr:MULTISPECIES: sulfatase-like hydrolase/transferase [Pirellulaceae]PQO26080.1 arylsulfatase [Blastopirellula marina]RCS44438.1 arylsulfatase [Bremerella cremea]
MKRLSLFIALLLLAIGSQVTSAQELPNFLVIQCDDLGYGDLQCYGHPSIKTPNLNKLASQGVRFTSCYSAAPVCSPSRAGLVTGQTPTQVGIYDWIPGGSPMHVKASEHTVAKLLKSAGYQTGLFGKWHCNGMFNSPKQPQPGDLGFDYWFATQNNAAPSHENPKNFVRNGKEVGPTTGFSCQVVAAEASHWLEDINDDGKPFFALVTFHEPHEPIASPDDLVNTYPDADKRGQALYYANVTNMDRAVGSLMQTLDKLGLADNTLVLFTSDNGPETLDRYPNAWRSHGSPGPLRGMKLHIYDGGIRVPGIARFPGKLDAGIESDVPVCSLDILPTFCEMAGVEIPADAQLDGTSLVGLFRGQPIQRAKPLFWHYYRAYDNAKVAVRDGDWKLVALWDQGEVKPGAAYQKGDYSKIKDAKFTAFELYNLTEDIGETKDVSADHPQIVAQLKKALLEKYDQATANAPDWFAEAN